MQFARRFWNDRGPWGTGTGSTSANTGYQNTWDGTRARPGATGIMVDCTRGSTTDRLSPRHAARRREIPATDHPRFPGLAQYWNSKVTRSLPHSSPFSNRSYSFWRVGQYQPCSGYEAVPQRNSYFGGEHTSTDYQGFMEGARAAGEVLAPSSELRFRRRQSRPRRSCAAPRFSIGPSCMDDWKLEFRNVWDRAVAAWRAGRKSPKTMFTPADVAFLSGLGCTAQELFDFVDDSLDYDDLDFETVLAVTAIRREYFLDVMHGQPTGRVVPMSAIPSKSAKVDGIAWLPRLIAKARIKLRGELNPDLMYGCAGDRPFLRKHRMTLSQFLQLVRDHGTDDRAIVEAVKKAAAGS